MDQSQDQPTPQIDTGTSIRHRQSLEAVKIKQCRHCLAPGCWRAPKNVEEIKHYAKWPGILVEPGDPDRVDGQPVGDHCPNCGGDRLGLLEHLGEIWHRVFR